MKRFGSLFLVVCLMNVMCLGIIGCAKEEQPATLQMHHSTLTIPLDGTLGRILVTCDDENKLTWSSSNPEIATVNQRGSILGIAPGTAVITCSDGQESRQCVVTIVPEIAPYDFSGPKTIQLRRGQRTQLSYIYTGNGTLALSSSDPQVVRVEDGRIVAKSCGEAIITCTDGLRFVQTRIIVKGVFAF